MLEGMRRRWAEAFGSTAEWERSELRDESACDTAEKCSQVQRGEVVTVRGRIVATTLASKAGTPVLGIEVDDGTGRVHVMFLGRRRVAGVETGRRIEVTGRVCHFEGRPGIYNPTYTLLP